MNVEFLKPSSFDNDSCRFKITNTSISFVNGLRRTIISQTPTLAIHIVEIHENTTTINDEMIAHRLGFLPLLSQNAKHMAYHNQCQCNDGCPKCEVEFKLHAKNTKDEFMSITNKHLITTSDVSQPTSETVLILNLAKNQEIKLTAKARKSVGMKHAKWNPATVAAYRGIPTILLNQPLLSKLSREDKELFVKSCPSQVFGFKEASSPFGGKSEDIEVIDPYRCMYCRDCFEVSGNLAKKNGLDHKDPKNSLVYIEASQKDFIFVLETTGVLTAVQLLHDALTTLENKILELQLVNRKLIK